MPKSKITIVETDYTPMPTHFQTLLSLVTDVAPDLSEKIGFDVKHSRETAKNRSQMDCVVRDLGKVRTYFDRWGWGFVSESGETPSCEHLRTELLAPLEELLERRRQEIWKGTPVEHEAHISHEIIGLLEDYSYGAGSIIDNLDNNNLLCSAIDGQPYISDDY